MKMKSSIFEDNIEFMNEYLKNSHHKAFSGYAVFARNSGLYVRLQARNRRNSQVIKTVGLNFDWKTLEVACKPWIKSRIDGAMKEVCMFKIISEKAA